MTAIVYADGFEPGTPSGQQQNWTDPENAYAPGGGYATGTGYIGYGDPGVGDLFLFPDVGPDVIPDGAVIDSVVAHVEVIPESPDGFYNVETYLDGAATYSDFGNESFDTAFYGVDLAALRAASTRVTVHVDAATHTANLDYVALVIDFHVPAPPPTPPTSGDASLLDAASSLRDEADALLAISGAGLTDAAAELNATAGQLEDLAGRVNS